MGKFINLNYFFRADTQDYQLILKKGFFDNHKTNGKYGKGIYIVDDKKINLTNKNVILNIDLASVDDILFVESYDILLKRYIYKSYEDPNNPNIITKPETDFDNYGITSYIGNKYIKKYAINHNLNGIKIQNEGTMILYNYTNVRYIRIYNEDLKTLRSYSAPNLNLNSAILWGNDNDSNPDENILTNDDDDIVWGNF